MTDLPPRYFKSDAEVRRLGTGLLACTLGRADWTHEAHLAACLWLIVERPDIVAERELPDIIRRFNESVGGLNDDHNGYHETITQVSIAGVRSFLARTLSPDHDVTLNSFQGPTSRERPGSLSSVPGLTEPTSLADDWMLKRVQHDGGAGMSAPSTRDSGTLATLVNALLDAPEGRRDWPLRFFTPALLFSVAARREMVPPDLAPLPVL